MRRSLLGHPHLSALEKTFGRQFISSMETAVQTFDPKIAEHLRKQSDLVMQYTDLLASAKIEFQGKTYNLSGLDQFMQNEDARFDIRRLRSALRSSRPMAQSWIRFMTTL